MFRSYTGSTDRHRPSGGKKILGGVVVPVLPPVTTRPQIVYPTPLVLTTGQSVHVAPATLGPPVLVYSSSPPLPAGLALDPRTGVITGTAPDRGTPVPESFTITASGPGFRVSIRLTLSVFVPLSYGGDLTIVVGTPASIPPVLPRGATPTSTFTLTPSGLPPGLSFDSATGTFKGSVTETRFPAQYTVQADTSHGPARGLR